ncbi:hypothetical protein ACTFIT_010202 [Dictyostelium discoideum]
MVGPSSIVPSKILVNYLNQFLIISESIEEPIFTSNFQVFCTVCNTLTKSNPIIFEFSVNRSNDIQNNIGRLSLNNIPSHLLISIDRVKNGEISFQSFNLIEKISIGDFSFIGNPIPLNNQLHSIIMSNGEKSSIHINQIENKAIRYINNFNNLSKQQIIDSGLNNYLVTWVNKLPIGENQLFEISKNLETNNINNFKNAFSISDWDSIISTNGPKNIFLEYLR